MAFSLGRTVGCRISGFSSLAAKYSAPTITRTIFLPQANSPSSALSLRNVSQNVHDDQVERKGIFRSIRARWNELKDLYLDKVADPKQDVESEEEANEYKEIDKKMTEAYYAKPPRDVPTELYILYVETCMKWDNWRRLERFYCYMEEWQIDMDEDLLDRVEDYLASVRQRPVYEKNVRRPLHKKNEDVKE